MHWKEKDCCFSIRFWLLVVFFLNWKLALETSIDENDMIFSAGADNCGDRKTIGICDEDHQFEHYRMLGISVAHTTVPHNIQ